MKFFFKKDGQARGKEAKNVKGVFFTDKTGLNLILSQKEFFFCKTNICEKHPLIAKKWVFILKNYLTNILPLFF